MTGTTLSHYRIVKELGRGGMGIVYRAEDTKLDRQVAIKVLPSSALASDDDRTRFYREAKAAAALNHPNIAQIYQIDEAVPSDAPHGTQPSPFIAMEYIDGETLDARIKKGPLKLAEAVRHATQIAGALGEAHDKGIVHRDVKASNVMLTSKGDAKVLDFGLALTAASTKLTRMGSTLGTVAYMSPEQARGEEVDRRTDLWALGVVLYEMVAGRNPFGGDYEQAVVYSILNAEPEPLTAVRTGVPMELERILNKALAKDKDLRYQTAADFVADLKRIDSSGSTVAGSLVRPAEAKEVDPTNTPWLPWAIGAAALLAGLVVGWFIRSPEPHRPLHVTVQLDPLEAAFASGSPGSRAISLSPDGSRLAFEGDEGLFVVDLSTGAEPELLVDSEVRLPTFSPDGEWIAVHLTGGLYKVRVSGGDPVRILDHTGDMPGLSWEDDGFLYYPPDFASGIYRVSENGGMPELVVAPRPDLGEIGLTVPSLVRSGRSLLIASYGEQGYEIKLIDLDNGERTDLERGFAPKLIGDHLIFAQGPRLLRAEVNGRNVGSPTEITDRIFSTGTQLAGQYTLSDMGDLAYVHGTDVWGRGIEHRRWDGSRELLDGAPDAVTFMDVSHDGSMMVFAAHPSTTEDPDIWSYDPARRDLRRLTTTPYWEGFPIMAPDGESVIFGSERAGQADIYRTSLSGTTELVYRDSTHIYPSDVSRDGRFILYQGGGIHVIDLRDTTSTNIIPLQGLVRNAVFSPDGSLVAYESDESGRSEVYVTDFPRSGRGRFRISMNGGARPRFSSSGRELYYIHAGNLIRVGLSASGDRENEPVVVISEMRSEDYALLPDGSGIITHAHPGTRRLRLIRNAFDE